jgi:hypothetical protein
MKRIALCIGNLAERGRRMEKAYLHGYNHIKEKILDKNENVDVFLHSWEPELKDTLLELYKPKAYFFEDQKNFEDEYNECDLNITAHNSYSNLFSMFYSRYAVNNILKEYSKNNNIEYDWVIFCRYDLDVEKIHCIEFDKNYDNNYLYMSMYDQLNSGPADHWFFGNQKDMDIILSLYSNLKEYCLPNSKFIKTCLEEWIDSNENDIFSCEILFAKNKSKGHRAPYQYILNPHTLYKWHIYINNLWNLNKLKFLITKKLEKYFIGFPDHPNVIKF